MSLRSGWWSLNIITATRLIQQAIRHSGRAALLRRGAARREETGESDRCVHSGRCRGLHIKIIHWDLPLKLAKWTTYWTQYIYIYNTPAPSQDQEFLHQCKNSTNSGKKLIKSRYSRFSPGILALTCVLRVFSGFLGVS